MVTLRARHILGLAAVIGLLLGLSIGNAFAAGSGNGVGSGNAPNSSVAIGSVTGLGTGCATWLATPTSANLRGCLTDESGTGLDFFQSGDLGTPSAGVLTNATGYTSAALVGAVPATLGGTGFTSYVTGQILYAGSSTTIAKLADVPAGSVICSQGVGVAPAYCASPALTAPTVTSLAASSFVEVGAAYTGYGFGAYLGGSTQVGYWSGNVNNGAASTSGDFYGTATDGSALIYAGSSLPLKVYTAGLLAGTFNASQGLDIVGALTLGTPLAAAQGGTGVTSLGSGVATWFGTPSSANLRAALTDETGTGLAYFQGGDAGTPSALGLANATGLPVGSLTGLGTGCGTFLATPSSANLRGCVTDESGGGVLLFAGGNGGVFGATSLALAGATIGSDTLSVGGSMAVGTSNQFTVSASGNTSIQGTLTASNSNFVSNAGSANAVGFRVYNGGTLSWSSTNSSTASADTGLSRDIAGVVDFGTGSAGSTAGSFKATNGTFSGALISTGSPPTLTGTCTTASQVGGNTAGSFTATCVSQTVIITFATTAPNGWACVVVDQTTPADVLAQSANSTTSCTVSGTTVALDRVVFMARAY